MSYYHKDGHFSAKLKPMTQTELPSIGQLLTVAWLQFKQQWKVWLKIMILPAAVAAVGNILLYFKPTEAWLQALTTTCLVVGNLGLAFAGLAVIHTMFTPVAPAAAWDKALSQWRSFLWLLLISFFFNVGGFLLLIIPGLLYSLWFSLAIFVFVKEDQRGLKALWRSRELFKGVFWRLVGRYLIILLIMMAISIISETIFGSNIWTSLIINVVITPLLTVFSYAYLAIIYVARAQAVPAQPEQPKLGFKVLIAPIAGWLLGITITLAVILSGNFKTLLNSQTLSNSDQLSRDIERQLVVETVLQPVLKEYYAQNKKYPSGLTMAELGAWLNDIPKDPTGVDYNYQLLQKDQSYKICPPFESQEKICYGPVTEATSTKQ